MIDFPVEVTIPANTSHLTPYQENITLSAGKLVRVWIGFPPGCARMVYVQVLLVNTPILPVTADQYYAYDGVVFERECLVQLDNDPYEITVRGYSDGTIYDHKISFIFQLVTDADDSNSLLQQLIG